MQIHEYFDILFAFCEYSVYMRLVFFRFLNICWYFQQALQIDMKILVFLAQCPHTEIGKMEFAWIFFNSHKYLQYFNAFGNYTSTNQKHFCIWKIHFKGLPPPCDSLSNNSTKIHLVCPIS